MFQLEAFDANPMIVGFFFFLAREGGGDKWCVSNFLEATVYLLKVVNITEIFVAVWLATPILPEW